MGRTAKRIAPGAYDALLEGLAVFYWKKSDLARFLRSELTEHPELLTGLNLDDPKRRTAEELVSGLSQNEERYQPVTIALLQQLAAFDDTFPHLRRWDDSEQLIANASAALAEVRKWVYAYSAVAAQREAATKQAEEDGKRYAARRSMSAELAQLKSAFLELSADSSEPQARGLAFERVLNDLFALWDLTPRGPFVLQHEQIDGAFTFDTDDYILEARWRKDRTSREELDAFHTKLGRKARNTRGLFISINGFSQSALDTHRGVGTAMILMDGTDVFLVLDERIELTELLERKRRHASETGDPMLSATAILRDA